MKKVYISAIMSVVVLLMAACSSPAQPTPTPAPQKVRLQLSWTDNHEYAGFYWADKQGFNQAENLNVELVPFNFDQTDLVKQVTSGATEFAISSGDQLLLERAKGAPIVAIATIYQRSPYCFISLKESKILKPADLVGKKILLTQRDEMFFNAMMTSQKLDPKLSTVIYRTDFTNDALFNGKADVIDAFVDNQPVQLETDGHPVNVMLPGDYGIEVYPDVIFTSEDFLKKNPEAVQRFLRTLTKGLQKSLENPNESAALAVAHNKNLTLEAEIKSMNKILPLMNPPGSRPGSMTPQAWEAIKQILVQQRLLDKDFDVTKAYDLTYFNQTAPK